MDGLVERLLEFEKGYDWYGYRDCFDTDEQAREQIRAALDDDPMAVIERLLDAIDEMEG